MSGQAAYARLDECMGRNRKQNMIAQVQRIGANHTQLHVINERTGMRRSFYAARGRLKDLIPGDRIRIYYYCGNSTLFSLKKMTAVKFDPVHSNRGYIQGSPKD